jgi:hypothetical protein
VVPIEETNLHWLKQKTREQVARHPNPHIVNDYRNNDATFRRLGVDANGNMDSAGFFQKANIVLQSIDLDSMSSSHWYLVRDLVLDFLRPTQNGQGRYYQCAMLSRVSPVTPHQPIKLHYQDIDQILILLERFATETQRYGVRKMTQEGSKQKRERDQQQQSSQRGQQKIQEQARQPDRK